MESEQTSYSGTRDRMRRRPSRSWLGESLLEEWLTKYIRINGENGPAIVIAPLKEVRNLRQSPAHKFVDDEFSIKYQDKKEELIAEVYRSLSNIRMFFQTHPKAQGYQFPDHLKLEHLVIF